MINSWKVIWRDKGKKFFKRFEGDSPKEAVEFGKQLKRRGLVVDGVVSSRRAYAPPSQNGSRPKGIWCPYCVKYRDFDEFSVMVGSVVLEPTLRCPVCHISINDAHVRRFNPIIFNEYRILEERRAARATRSRM